MCEGGVSDESEEEGAGGKGRGGGGKMGRCVREE